MTFKETLAQVIDWLQENKRISYRALKRQFDLNEDYLEDLKYELIKVQQLAVDQDSEILDQVIDLRRGAKSAGV